MNRKVCVLLSTFNGEKYLEEAIDSILDQQEIELTLVVRDDGSCDGTHSILRRYTDSRLKIIDSGNHLGVQKSFLKLLEETHSQKFDYFAFADQDDLWEPKKIINAVTILESENKDLYSSRRKIIRGKQVTNELFPKEYKPETLSINLFQNYHAGCTMLISKRFANQLISNSMLANSETIDHSIFQIAYLLDSYVYDSNAYILYRIHQDNDVGISEGADILKRIRGLRKYKQQLRYLTLLDLSPASSKANEWNQTQLLTAGLKKKIETLRTLNFRTSKVENIVVKLCILLTRFH
jgi:glycosyltransferase involved in cell wall biosynthesis